MTSTTNTSGLFSLFPVAKESISSEEAKNKPSFGFAPSLQP
jgi:hypothetical protein